MSEEAGGTRRLRDVELGQDVRIMDFVNLYGCSIGDHTLVGPFVEIQDRVRIGRRCKIESHSFVCSGTVIEDGVFVGHHAVFTNDRYPAATTGGGEAKRTGDWTLEPAVVEEGASIGSGAVILPGVRIGVGAVIGAGAVVTKDVVAGTTVAGNPARVLVRRSRSAGVPLFDPAAEHDEVGAEIDAAIDRVVRSGRFVGGPEVEAFEREFGEALGRDAAAVGSGTDALRLSLMALEIGAGDEVVIPANTFTATAMALESLGAVPVVADVDPDTYVVTATTLERVIGEATRGLIPVHLYGHPAPMAEILDLAASRGIAVLEDAAQAFGASRDGTPAGAFAPAAGFSFYPSKNLGAYGDGGAVVGEPWLVERVRGLRDLGRGAGGEHLAPGLNSRLDAVQAAILRAKLPHVAGWVARRGRLAERYLELLVDMPVVLPVTAPGTAHAWHLFVVRVAERDRVLRELKDKGIGAGVHYPVPIHLQPAHAGRVKAPEGAPVAERLSGEILSLPLYPQMTGEQQAAVVESLRAALAGA